jgi:MarR family transcriptional regulator, transcriptional regulator for hemolysin
MRTAPHSEFPMLLHDVAHQMRTYANQLAREHGTTRAQWAILALLERQPGLSQNELAALAEVAPITVARLIDRLEEQGLVERSADPGDRRIWRLRLTPAAAPVLRQIKRYRAKLHNAITKDIAPAVLDAMMVGLRQMKKNLSTTRRLAAAPA